MIIKLNNNQSNETVFVAFRNVDGAGSITQNTPACYVVDGNSVNGINASHSRAASFKGAAGLARSTVAINGYGLATAYGNHASALISDEVNSITITAGDALTFVAGTGLGMSSVGGVTLAYTNLKYAVAGSTVTLSQTPPQYVDNVICKLL